MIQGFLSLSAIFLAEMRCGLSSALTCCGSNYLPRAIGNLAIACLVQARALGVARVDEEVFHQAAGEFLLT